ncbi:MAG TPA: glycogen/starch/alpha-glucan phosphorylase [Smithellaceae bacterium]|nr:glycogen/starch/alpha-glucan phosphorylase [Smithellaceae bacterium]
MVSDSINEGMQVKSRISKIKNIIEGKLKRYYGRSFENASKEEMFQAVAMSIRDIILERGVKANETLEKKGMKRLCYLSAEFLMGRALVNNMINLGLLEEYRAVMTEIGYPFEKLEEQENEAALGNGGLGRLAACFLDSLSTLNLPVTGYGIRYEYGMFCQRIIEGQQTEVPDDWTAQGDIWEIERRAEQLEVHFDGMVEEVWTDNGLTVVHKNYQTVMAVPYDMPVIGYDSHVPATLRLWRAECPAVFDLHSFNKGDFVCMLQQKELAESISKVLYPKDDHINGRMLRLRQYYFLASATMQCLVREHKKMYGDVRSLPEKVVIQINDIHPALAIPDLMRILIDAEGLGWDEAYDIVSRMFNYTNHTVMQEALAAWPEQLFKTMLPRVYAIVSEIDERFRQRLCKSYPDDRDKTARMSIIAYDEVRTANLCVAVCNRVNGVSQLHGRILKSRTFRDFYVMFPGKFTAITNGITQRRWLAAANPALCELIYDHIGDQFIRDCRELERLKPYVDDRRFLDDFAHVKQQNKKRLSEYMQKRQGIALDPGSVFDVQAKRLHEYKRQLLKVLHILHLYRRFTENDHFTLPRPVTFLFAAKASPAYWRAKSIIHLISVVSALVDSHPRTRENIRVVFLENYNVTLAEHLIPAADISEQISTAGCEASGTGNMKFMLNGAVTLGTMDGANVEIFERVGKENIFIFGADAQEIDRIGAENSYHPKDYFDHDEHIREALSCLVDGTLPGVGKDQFQDLYRSLLYGDYDRADKYYLLYDFDAYRTAFEKIMGAYNDTPSWTRKAAVNTASAGYFSVDRTIEDYNRMIWGLDSI